MKPIEAVAIPVVVGLIVYLFFIWLPWALLFIVPVFVLFLYELLMFVKELITGVRDDR